jgi:hypothetical protein
MPVLCDFTIITEPDRAYDTEFRIGAGDSRSAERRTLRLRFGTGGRRDSGLAVLLFCVKGLTRTDRNPEIRINGQKVGEISHYMPASSPENPENSNHWYNQTITFDASILDDGDGLDNTLAITSVPTLWQEQEGRRENFRIRNIVCFFHQRS